MYANNIWRWINSRFTCCLLVYNNHIKKILTSLTVFPLLGTSLIPLSSCSSTQYTVTFDTQGGSTINPVKVDKGSKVTEPTDPTREGYTFSGWFSDKECIETFDFNTPITSNITLYAKWEEQEVFDKEQWNKIFTPIADCRDETRNFTLDGEMTYHLEGESSKEFICHFTTYSANKCNESDYARSKNNGIETHYSAIKDDAICSTDSSFHELEINFCQVDLKNTQWLIVSIILVISLLTYMIL